MVSFEVKSFFTNLSAKGVRNCLKKELPKIRFLTVEITELTNLIETCLYKKKETRIFSIVIFTV